MVADWVLFWAGWLVVIWLVATARAATRLGPIEVEKLKHDGESDTPVEALSAALRERLAKIGLPSPAWVPAGTPEAGDLVSAVEASGVSQAAFVAKLLRLMPRPPTYHVSGVLLGDEPSPPAPPQPFAGDPVPTVGPCGLNFWVQPAREGSPLDEDRQPQMGVRAHGRRRPCRIYLHVCRTDHRVPVWARWSDPIAVAPT